MKKKFEIPVIAKYEINLNENIALSGGKIEELVKGAQWYFTHEAGGAIVTNDSRCFVYVTQNTTDDAWNMVKTGAVDMTYARFLVWISSLISDARDDNNPDNDSYASQYPTGCASYN